MSVVARTACTCAARTAISVSRPSVRCGFVTVSTTVRPRTDAEPASPHSERAAFSAPVQPTVGAETSVRRLVAPWWAAYIAKT